MAPRIFVTGATGYVGGDALARFHEAHPDWQYRCLVRDDAKAARIALAYPNVYIVKGSLDDVALLEAEAKAADIVLQLADADHVAAAQAIARGVSSRGQNDPAYWIHCSGTGILLYADIDNKRFGERSDEIWDDMDIEKIHKIPDHAAHRNVDQIVFKCGEQTGSKVKTAIVCPPTIYGPGRGTGNRSSIQLPNLTRLMLQRGEVFQIGQGKSLWSHVHVRDLSNVWLLLAEAATQGGGKASWGHEGYYFAEAGDGDHVWGEVSQALGKVLKQRGIVGKETPANFMPSEAEAAKMSPPPLYMWGTNSRSRATRTRKLLGWQPKEANINGTLEQLVDLELAQHKQA